MSRASRFVRRRTGTAPQGGPADFHYRSESKYYADMEQARDMDRNDCVVGQGMTRSADNVIQDGFTLNVKTGDKKLDLALWQDFDAWAKEPELCDIAGEMNFHDYEYLGYRSSKADGDAVITGTTEGSLQFFEAHTIQTTTAMPNVFLGVELNKHRKRLKYYYRADDVDGKKTKKEQAVGMDVRDEDGVRQLFHIYKPNRATLTRGVTALAPIFAISGMFEDINFAKLVQQQVVSCFAILRQRAAVQGNTPPSTDVSFGARDTEQTSTGEVRTIDGVSPGMDITGAVGETISGFSPDVPNAEFFSHVKLMLQLIGVNLGLPLCLLLMDGSETNFSGWRGAVDEARKGFINEQKNMVKRFHTPVYKWWLNRKLLSCPILQKQQKRAKIDLFGHEWSPPSWPYIEPVNDAAGDLLRIKNTLISPRRLHNERSRDWEEIAEETVEDNAYAIQKAMAKANAMNKENPDQKIEWRDLIGLPMPDGKTMSTTTTELPLGESEPVSTSPSDPASPEKDGQPAKNISKTALNGAQVTSLVEVVRQVGLGELPIESARSILTSAFPEIEISIINSILEPIEVRPQPNA